MNIYEEILADPASSEEQKVAARKMLDKAKPAVLVSGEGKEDTSFQDAMTYLDNDIHGLPNPPEIAAQFKKARELENAFYAASDKLRGAVQNYAEDKFKDLPEGGEKNCQVRNYYLDVFNKFDWLAEGRKPEYPSEEIKSLVEKRNAANAAQFPHLKEIK